MKICICNGEDIVGICWIVAVRAGDRGRFIDSNNGIMQSEWCRQSVN